MEIRMPFASAPGKHQRDVDHVSVFHRFFQLIRIGAFHVHIDFDGVFQPALLIEKYGLHLWIPRDQCVEAFTHGLSLHRDLLRAFRELPVGFMNGDLDAHA